jgi:hypothetical protein
MFGTRTPRWRDDGRGTIGARGIDDYDALDDALNDALDDALDDDRDAGRRRPDGRRSDSLSGDVGPTVVDE